MEILDLCKTVSFFKRTYLILSAFKREHFLVIILRYRLNIFIKIENHSLHCILFVIQCTNRDFFISVLNDWSSQGTRVLFS